MNATELSQTLLDQSDASAREQFLAQNADQLDDELIQMLKDRADYFLRINIHRTLEIAEIMFEVSRHSGKPEHRAMGLLAQANAYGIGLGDHETASEKYTEASVIYRQAQLPVREAQAQIGHVWALANLGRYEEAIAISEQAARVLEQAGEWLQLGKLTLNTAIIHGRQGNDAEALATLDKAYEIFEKIGEEGVHFLPWIEQNRSILLRNLGRLSESIAASEKALAGMDALEQPIEAARAKQNLGVTYLLLGRYNEALSLMDEARSAFLADGRQRDALLLDLYLSDCLLQLRRFDEVTAITRNARSFFNELGLIQEVGRTLLNEAVAYAGLGRYDEALASLDEARQYFAEDANPVWLAESDLERAALLIRLKRLEESEALLQSSEHTFQRRGLPLKVAQARLQKAQIALLREEWARAERLARQVLKVAQEQIAPTLAFNARHVLAQVLHHDGDLWQAMTMYERAITILEKLHSQLTVAFQADFLEDKSDIYQEAVQMALQMGQPAKALELAERSKSRSLLTMLSNRVDRGIHTRNREDEALVQELLRLRAERDRLTLRWETGEEPRAGGDIAETGHRVWLLERDITRLWEQLLLRDAAYARDAMLWQVRVESPQPWLDEETLLLEYFFAEDQLYLFMISHDSIDVQPLETRSTDITMLLNLLALNNRSISRMSVNRLDALTANAMGLLKDLYDRLVQPIASRIDAYPQLIIVPHDVLHHTPFHALFDGNRYLIESHEISYLPASSLLRFVTERQAVQGEPAIFGYSSHGLLPHAVEEARTVASLMQGRAFVEEQATTAAVRQVAPEARLIHFATHGEFRADNPLFSGLLLADGWLTALDIYNLRFRASLVILSACSSGRKIIGGGDELLGLSRSFLYAGASSLLLSYWQLPDEQAKAFITRFYQELIAGKRKAAALRQAQLHFLRRDDHTFAHPHAWASFFLMGDPGAL